MNGGDHLDQTARLFKALGNTTRVAIVDALIAGPRCVHELVDDLGVDQPLVSQHLRVLRSVNLLRTERRGKEVVYSLADDHVAHIVRDAITHTQETQEKK
jgi:DNA-binding transcriptional ArsR family regulator